MGRGVVDSSIIVLHTGQLFRMKDNNTTVDRSVDGRADTKKCSAVLDTECCIVLFVSLSYTEKLDFFEKLCWQSNTNGVCRERLATGLHFRIGDWLKVFYFENRDGGNITIPASWSLGLIVKHKLGRGG